MIRKASMIRKPTRRTRRTALTGSICLVALSGLTFALASGCSRSEAAPERHVDRPTSLEKGPRVDSEHYTAEMRATGPYQAGKEGIVEVTIAPKAGYKINQQYPYKFKPAEGAAGVTYPKALLKKEDGSFDEKQGVFKIPFVPAGAGKAKVSGVLSLSVCSEANCLMEKQELSLDVDVK